MPWSQRMAETAGIAGGLARGSIEMAALAGITLKNLVKLTSSTAWKTISAVAKNDLADAIARGDTAKASLIISKMLEGIKNIFSQPNPSTIHDDTSKDR
jgi:hypothetical protein